MRTVQELKQSAGADDAWRMVGALLIVFVAPAGLLAHELGHGCAALWLTDGPVQVLVGRQPGLLRCRLGRLGLHLHLASARGVGWSGLCIYKRTGVPRDDMAILAAGPIASLLWAIVCTANLVLYGAKLTTIGEVALILGAVEGIVAFVYNGAAAVLPELMSARPLSDGAKFQQAIRARRGLRELESRIGRPMTKAELREIIATKRIPLDAMRSQTSVAPPTHPDHRET